MDRFICYKHDIRHWIVRKIKEANSRPIQFKIKQRYTVRQAKDLILKKRFAISANSPSWFYTAFERGNKDPLTNYALEFLDLNIEKAHPILVTGGGVGIMAFHLADSGFDEITVTDLLPEVVEVGQEIKNRFNYNNVIFIVDDCLNPKKEINKKYGAITALHWVFSAFMGNYGNEAVKNPFDIKVREKALNNFFEIYGNKLYSGGFLLVELTDACADYRIYTDHPSMDKSAEMIYPVRHSPEMVNLCASKNDLTVIDKKMSVRTGHHPRTLYVLRKN